jgi:prolyl 4-hydroxylase
MRLHFLFILAVYMLLFEQTRSFFFGKSVDDDDYDATIDPNDYGVDVSFPMHHYNGQRQVDSKNPMKSYFAKRYESHMKGCYDKYSYRECDANERARVEMSLEQPASQYNYTKTGFHKRRLPDEIFTLLKNFYDENKGREQIESWPRGNTYVNHWVVPTSMVSFENPQINDGYAIKQKLWDSVKPIIEEWTGHKLQESSLYGIRVYKNESVLATHVDRLPLVSSCIIQVAQDIDEPWPIEVIGHDRKAHNVTMVPGDMVLYESHSILHGRPFPMKGRFYANVFVHYIPIGHDERNGNMEDIIPVNDHNNKQNVKDKAEHKFGGHENQNIDTITLQKHLADHDNENRGKLRGDIVKRDESHFELQDGQTELHIAAQVGDALKVKKLLDGASPTLLHARDINNWQAVHEAARAGHVEVLKLLVDKGADITARTVHGASPLYWAKNGKGSDNKNAIKYLESLGAPYNEDENDAL